MSDYDYDVLIIGGGGSAGFTAATTAMKSGARVAMIEGYKLGGLCILAGCMPSKALIHSADDLRAAGADRSRAYPEVIRFKRKVVDFLANKRVMAVEAKKKQGLQVLNGTAKFSGPHTVEVDGKAVTAGKIVIATGSTEIIPDVPGLADCGYLISDTFLELENLPESLVVLGGGTMALELAQYAAHMDVEVTLIQRSAHVLSGLDERIGLLLQECLSDDGVNIFTETKLVRIEGGPGDTTVVFEHRGKEKTVKADALLLSLGRRPNTAGLNLEAAGVETGPGGRVLVDDCMRTNVEHVFAAGDVTARLMVVNQAILEGETAGRNATAPQAKPIDDAVVPRAIFTDPQVAMVGLSAEQAAEAGIEFVEAYFDMGDLAAGKTYPGGVRGFMTMRADAATGKLIGADLVSPEASLMIHDSAITIKLGGTPGDIGSIPYTHPCLAEVTEMTAGRLARMLKKQ